MTSSMQQMAEQRTTTPSRHLGHIRELDGIRGLAALLVFFHHLCFTSLEAAGWGAPVRALRTIFSQGSSGVDVFFVLSGFLITAILIESRKSSSYYKDFYWKRALRILPLYILVLVGVLLFMPDSTRYVILSAFFISNFAQLLHITTEGPLWTLAIEEQFYLIWPTVVRRRSIEQLRHWALGIGITAIVLRLVAAIFGHYNYHFTFFRCDALAAGAFLACWYLQRDPFRPYSRRENRAIRITFMAGAVLFALSFLPTTNPQLFSFVAASNLTGITFISGSIIAYVISHTGRKSIAWLRSPLLTFFGLISYAMYMIHIYVMFSYDHLFGLPHPGDNLAYVIRILAVLAITITLCVITRYLIELPAISLRKYVLARPRT
jgi:peptidoglycan/LPS O-acetylase OafA/YrhL